MCVLSVYINNNPSAWYRVVIASNRDEFYDRKTQALTGWLSANGVKCVAGRDCEPGREGGTWLGVAETGKVGVLLNVREVQINPDAKPRGNLVVNYIGSGVDCSTYAAQIEKEASEYNGFQLIAIERERTASGANCSTVETNAPWKLLQLCNRRTPATKLLFGKEVSSNCIFAKTFASASLVDGFPKMTAANRRFVSIIERADSSTNTEQLFNEIETELLKCRLDQLACEQELKSLSNVQRSAKDQFDNRLNDVFVSVPELRYGTRTHTLIAIDRDARCTIRERTLIEPIQTKLVEKESAWQTTRCTLQF